MAKVSAGIKVLIIFLAILFAAITGFVVVYKMELFPSLIQKFHDILGLNVVEEDDYLKNQQEELLREQNSIGTFYPHIIPVTEEVVESIRQSREQFGFGFSQSKAYTVEFLPIATESESEGDIEIASDSEVYGEPIWSYQNEYPVVSPAADFYDRVVFIDAKPSLVILDKTTGSETLRIPCQVSPGQEAFSHLQSYYFKSKTGNWYEMRFEEGLTKPESLAVVHEVKEKGNVDEAIYNSLLPQKDALDFINAKMNGLLSVSPAVSVDQSILYSVEGAAFSFNRSLVSPAFVFSPKEQGTYTLGLCDETGNWVRDNAFVVLYTMAGEALAISLDYVADRPQITTHLSNQELYVACVGFFPDTLLLDAAPSQDFRDDASSRAPANGEGNEMELEMVELVLDSPATEEASAEATEGETLVSDTPETLPQRAWFQVEVAP